MLAPVHCLLTDILRRLSVEEAVHQAKVITRVLYESDYAAIKADDILRALAGDARLKFCERSELLGIPVMKLAAKFGLVHSNGASALSLSRSWSRRGASACPDLMSVLGAARDLVKNKGLYLNSAVVSDTQYKLTEDMLFDGRLVIISAGNKKRLVLAIA